MTADRTETVLEEIDGALTAWGTVDRDCAVSPDAMRWTPEKPEKPDPLPFAGCEIRVRIDVTEFLAGLEAMRLAFEHLWVATSRAAGETASLAATFFGYSWEDGKLHYHAADASRRVRRRCRACRPLAFQSPFPDGAYYRRRQLARRRRNRRRG